MSVVMSYTRKSYPPERYAHGEPFVPPRIRVDRPEDDVVECEAWVEVCEECLCPEMAQAFIEHSFPVEDRPEEEGYHASGEQVWLRPTILGVRHRYWQLAEPRDPRARKFWTVRVVCFV